MSTISPISGRILSGIPETGVMDIRREASTTGDERTSVAAQIDLSWASDMRRATLRATADKTVQVKLMLETLKKIHDHTASLRSYAEALNRSRDMALAMSKLSTFSLSISEFVEALLIRIESFRIQELADGGTSDFAADMRFDQLKLQVEEADLLTAESIERFRQRMGQNVSILRHYEAYLVEQLAKCNERMRELGQELDDRYGITSSLDKALAREMATVTSEQILQGFDITLGIDNVQESCRIARLLRDATQRVMHGT
jgi:hypothetical protein